MRIVVVLAHPDDEMTCGGTIARCTSRGDEVTLVCATNGAGGVSSTDIGGEALGEVRKRELRAACNALGITRLELLEDAYDAGFSLHKENYDKVQDVHQRLVEKLLAEVEPDAVITFGPDGVTGHRSHILVGELTDRGAATAARNAALYHIAYRQAEADALRAWFAAHPDVMSQYASQTRVNPRLGPPIPQIATVPDAQIAVTVDVRAVRDVKAAGIRAHATQGGGGKVLDAFTAPDTESFVRVHPARAPGAAVEAML